QEKGGLKSLGSVAFLDIHLGCPRKSQLLKNLRGGDEPGLAAGLVDLVEYTPVAEMFRLCLHPTAELVVDGEELHLHETVRIFLRGMFRVARAVVVLRGKALTFSRVEIIEISFGNLAGTPPVGILIDHGHGRFGENGDGGNDDLELTGEFSLSEESFVFPGDEDIADATLHKGGGGATGARVEYRHVLVDLADKFPRLGVVITVIFKRIGIGGEIVPARATGGFRVRRDDLDARLC